MKTTSGSLDDATFTLKAIELPIQEEGDRAAAAPKLSINGETEAAAGRAHATPEVEKSFQSFHEKTHETLVFSPGISNINACRAKAKQLKNK